VLSLPVTVGGVVLAAGLVGGSGVGRDPALGTVHVGLAALCYAGYLYLLRRGGTLPVQRVLDVSLAGAVVSIPAGLAWQGIDVTPGWAAFGWLLLLSLTSQVLGWLLIASATPRVPAYVGAVLLMLVPVGAVALAAPVLGEHPTWVQLTGCLLVLAGVQAATLHRR
jgi:drug/metabolite transporter (DMT)-like permease